MALSARSRDRMLKSCVIAVRHPAVGIDFCGTGGSGVELALRGEPVLHRWQQRVRSAAGLPQY